MNFSFPSLNINEIIIVALIASFLITFILLIILLIVVLSKAKNIDLKINKISDQINFVVSPRFIEISLDVEKIIDLAFDIWKINQKINKLGDVISETQRHSIGSSIINFNKYVEKYNIEIIDYTNKPFTDSMNVDVISIEKDPKIAQSIVLETVEPTIKVKDQVVRRAKVIILSN